MVLKLVRYFFLILFILALAIGYWFYRANYYINEKPLQILNPGYIVNVTPGMSIQQLADQLKQDHVFDYPDWLVMWIKLSDQKNKIKAGEYFIKPGMTAKNMIDMMVAGKVMLHALTIIEGWNFDRMMEAIHQAPKLKHTLIGLDQKQIMEKIGHPDEHPEGRFCPETYHFPAGTTDVQFLQRAYRLLNDKLSKAWVSRDPKLPLKTPYEALILASIIEKESGIEEEYPEIAGVFIRRLERKMPLQADPTVIYGAGKCYNGQITKEMLAANTAYNTYLLPGLPPTPISLPGPKAIYAATHPKQGDTLYFVAKGEGKGHVFSKTLSEHQIHVQKYRRLLLEKEMNIGMPVTAIEKSLTEKNENRKTN